MYAVRLLYRPEVRRRVSILVMAICVVYYLFQAATWFAQLGQKRLDFDFSQFWRAALDVGAGRNPYQFYLDLHCPAWCLGGYIYTPLVATIMAPLGVLPERAAAGIWTAASHLMVLATIVILYRALRRDVSPAAMACLLAAGLVFQPIFENLNYIQIGPLLLLVLAAAAVLYLRGNPRSAAGAGALVALAAVIKVTPLLMIPALVPIGWARGPAARVAREVGAAYAGLVAMSILLLGGMLLLIPYTSQFFTEVLPRIGGGVAAFDNKSFPGFIAQVFQILGGPRPPATPLALATIAIFMGPPVVLAALASPARLGPRGTRAAYFAAMVAAMPIVSTITWRHHLLVSYLAIVLLAVCLWPRSGRPASRAARWLVVIAYVLMSLEDPMVEALALGGVGHTAALDIIRVLVIVYANLWGMIALWLAAVIVLRVAVREAATAPIADELVARRMGDRMAVGST